MFVCRILQKMRQLVVCTAHWVYNHLCVEKTLCINWGAEAGCALGGQKNIYKVEPFWAMTLYDGIKVLSKSFDLWRLSRDSTLTLMSSWLALTHEGLLECLAKGVLVAGIFQDISGILLCFCCDELWGRNWGYAMEGVGCSDHIYWAIISVYIWMDYEPDWFCWSIWWHGQWSLSCVPPSEWVFRVERDSEALELKNIMLVIAVSTVHT